MSKIPFKKFIITFLLFNKSIAFIIEKLKAFGYFIKEDEVKEIFDEVRQILPASITELINAGGILNIEDEIHIQWLKNFEIFEYYDYIIRRDLFKGENETSAPEYFKWCSDCLWIHSHKDVMCLVNIFLFNDEPVDEISSIVMFKYKKKIGVGTLNLYRRMFWDTSVITAKEALYHCEPFRNNALVIRQLRSGGIEVSKIEDSSHDGSDVAFNFHDSSYIKWKIGYRKIEAPSIKDFIEKIKTDSYYKYYETMNMTQSIEEEDEDGTNQFGAFDKTTVRKRNVEEQRAKQAKYWMDIYLRANSAMPKEEEDKDDFFGRMQQIELDFEENEDEKIVSITECPHILNDIKGDMSSSA